MQKINIMSGDEMNNMTLRPLADVNRWDTKRVGDYTTRIHNHIVYLESVTVEGEQSGMILEKFQNYKVQLDRILDKRKNIK